MAGMSGVAINRRGAAPGCSCFGCACGCGIWLFLFLVFLGGLAWYYFPTFSLLRQKPTLPQIPRPTREDRLSLEQKLASLATGSPRVELSLNAGELNAWLDAFDPVPALGVAAEKLLYLPGNNRGTLIVTGSGFWMSDLTIILEMKSFLGKSGQIPEFDGVQINSFKVTSPGLLSVLNRRVFQYFEKTIGRKNKAIAVLFDKIEFSPTGITLGGKYPFLQPAQEGE